MTNFAGTELQRGAELAGYRIEALLGRGGMGVVYLAEQLRLKRRVALKLLAPELAADQRFRERFLRESELAASLDHPNVVPIFDAGEAEGLLYIAMRYVEGTDLGSLLAQEERLGPERAVAIVGSVASALDAAHARGLVHRDVKPANVLLAADGHVYLADFGLTRSAHEGAPEEKPHLSGTLEYVAPEQIEGEPPDPRADIYALGCVLYHSLAGQPPFAKRTQMELLWAHFNEDPPSLHDQRPELPEAIDPVIATALAKEPDQRYQSGRELAAAAGEALGVGVPRRRSRRKLLLIAAAIALVVAVASAVPSILLSGGDNNPAKPTTLITRDTLQRIDPDSNRLVATIPYGQAGIEANFAREFAAGALDVGEGFVWVFGPKIQTVQRIDPKNNSVAGQSAVSLNPNADLDWTGDVQAEGSRVFVVTGTRTVTVIDPRTSLLIDPIEIPGVDACFGLRPAYRSVLVFCSNPDPEPPVSVWRIDPQMMKATPLAELQDEAEERRGNAFRVTAQPGEPPGERLWLTDFYPEQSTTFSVYDMATARLLAGGMLPFQAGDFRVRGTSRDDASSDGNTSAWASNPEDDTVWQLDGLTGQVENKIPVGDVPTGLAIGDGAVWVVNSGDGTVSRIDPATGKEVATITVGGSPQGIAVGEAGVWVTVYPSPDAAGSQGTPISLSTALVFDEGTGCDVTHRCANHGTFAAATDATGTLLCPEGTLSELFYFPTAGEAFTVADRTLTCPDGSTLVMHVRRVEDKHLTPTTVSIGETWTVTSGTGRFADLKGEGTMEETFDTGVTPNTLGGSLTGNLG